MNEIILNSSIRDRLIAQDRKASGLCPAQKLRSRSAQLRQGGRKTAAVRSRLGLQPLQDQTGFQTELRVSFTFSNSSNVVTLIIILLICFQRRIYESSHITNYNYNFKININKSSVKYLRGINFS
jgi:hypothetical protein